ncbi:MAG: hypothetical protein ACOC57_06800 [Acidobacteriota bacterium]
MKTILSLAKGFSLTRKNASLILIFFLTNLILSLVLTAPIYSSLNSSLSRSQTAEAALEEFDYLWWREFRDQAQGIEKSFSPTTITGKGPFLDNLVLLKNIGFFNLPYSMAVGFLLFLFVKAFLSAGLLSIYNQEQVNSRSRTFFGEGIRFFPRFLIIMFVSWIFFLLVGICLNQFLGLIVKRVAENSVSDRTPFFLNLFFSLFVLLLLFFIQMLFDYARINVVVQNSKNIIKSIIQAFSFVFNNLGKTLSLFYLIILIQFVLVITFIFVEGRLPQHTFPGIIVLLVVQQLFILGIISLRCWLYASELSLYKDIIQNGIRGNS